MATIPEALDIARGHHAAGNLAEAERVYRQVLKLQPRNADALHLLGLVTHQSGKTKAAIDLIDKALAQRPDFPEALFNLGIIFDGARRPAEAVAVYERAVAVRPDWAEAHDNLGSAMKNLGRLNKAVEHHRLAIAARPDFAQAHNNLGVVYAQMGRHDDAMDSYDKALALRPDLHEAHANKSSVLSALGRAEEAIASCRQALALKPDDPHALCNLGNALGDIARVDEAVAVYRKALDVAPGYAMAHNGLGLLLALQGRTDQAIEHYETALRLQPDLADARLNRGLALLVKGRLRAGWRDYEARLEGPKSHRRRPFPQPWWTGKPLRGATLLLWGEQGLGDEIMGVGMLADAARLGGPLVLECEPRLVDLFARSFPAVSVVARADPPHPRTLDADLQIPLLSLARHYRRNAEDFPRYPDGYLVPDVDSARHWKAWLDELGPGLKIGLSWKGRKPAGRPSYYPPLEKLSVILDLPGLVFVNLQYDEVAEDIATMRRDMGVEVHCPPGLDLTNDLDGVAALISNLDVVVGPLTVAVILAGALGRMAWLYAYYPVYGEMCILNLDYVPWCPSIRVEKYGFGEDRREALARVADGLRALTANG